MIHGNQYIFKIGDKFAKITRGNYEEAEKYVITELHGNTLTAKLINTNNEKVFYLHEIFQKNSNYRYEFFK